MNISENSRNSRVLAFREELSNPNSLNDYVRKQMKRLPYHTDSGKNLITEYNKLLSERKVNKDE